jgi:hypothetical protein
MNRPLIVAILLLAAVPGYAQGQQPDVAKLKADARKVVGAIGSDKAKTEIYCQTLDLGEQLEQADQEKNRKKAQLQKKLGRDFVALADALEEIDPESPEGKELISIIDSLDAFCD